MDSARDASTPPDSPATALQVYLLGSVDFEAALRLQRRLHFEISGDRSQAALILCEHPPLITVGRQGSRKHIHQEPQELETRGWRVRWVNRAGGVWLHLPGQLAVYAILPLDRHGLTVADYLPRLGQVAQRLLGDFDIRSDRHDGGVWEGPRLLACIGVAVRDWISYYGLCLNVHPDLDLYRLVRCVPGATEPMTSLERERRGRVRPQMVRERLVEHFQEVFGLARVSLFTEHPALESGVKRYLSQPVG